MRGLRAICFDLDDTLWDVRSVLARAEQAVSDFLDRCYPEFGIRHPVETRLAARRELASEQPERAHDLTWLRTESMRRLAVAAGLPASLGEEAFAVFMEQRNAVELFADVLPSLGLLRRRYALATFSNGNADLHRIGIAAHFTVTLNAIAVGAAKPDPRSFAAVTAALDLPPATIAYVGDDPRVDVAGARAAGMQTIWINRGNRPWPDDHEPPGYQVRSLAELVELAERGAS
jgi:putative hydrolase of the HAD superfamily